MRSPAGIETLQAIDGVEIEQLDINDGAQVSALQRRLEEEGATFSELVNGVRRDLVLRYLDNPGYSLGRIADMLGYSMASSFTRWFITQFGMPPAAWRAPRWRNGRHS